MRSIASVLFLAALTGCTTMAKEEEPSEPVNTLVQIDPWNIDARVDDQRDDLDRVWAIDHGVLTGFTEEAGIAIGWERAGLFAANNEVSFRGDCTGDSNSAPVYFTTYRVTLNRDGSTDEIFFAPIPIAVIGTGCLVNLYNEGDPDCADKDDPDFDEVTCVANLEDQTDPLVVDADTRDICVAAQSYVDSDDKVRYHLAADADACRGAF